MPQKICCLLRMPLYMFLIILIGYTASWAGKKNADAWILCMLWIVKRWVCVSYPSHTWSHLCCRSPFLQNSTAQMSPKPQSPCQWSCCHGNWSRGTANYRKHQHPHWRGLVHWENGKGEEEGEEGGFCKSTNAFNLIQLHHAKLSITCMRVQYINTDRAQ